MNKEQAGTSHLGNSINCSIASAGSRRTPLFKRVAALNIHLDEGNNVLQRALTIPGLARSLVVDHNLNSLIAVKGLIVKKISLKVRNEI